MNNFAEHSDQMQINQIGNILSPFKSKFAVPRQSGLIKEIHSKIQLKRNYQPEISLQGLERFSHVWLLWSFHLNDNNSFKAKVTPPRFEGNKVGVFSTRSPHRPNPIGMSVVELVEVGKDHIWVKGADLVDQTPIIDIKPYLPQYDSIPEAKKGWLELVKDSIEEVCVSDDCREKFNEVFENLTAKRDFASSEALINFLSSLIKEDPRPQQHRKGINPKEDFVLDIYNFELFFSIKDKLAQIKDFNLKPINS